LVRLYAPLSAADRKELLAQPAADHSHRGQHRDFHVLLGVVVAMYDAFYLSKPEDSEAARLVTRSRVSLTVAIPKAYMQRIKQCPACAEAMATNWFGGTYKDARDVRNQSPALPWSRRSCSPSTRNSAFPRTEARLRARAHGLRHRRDLANDFHFKLGDRINMTGDIFPGSYEFTIRGIFDSPRDSRLMYMNREYIDQSLSELRRGMVGMYLHPDRRPAEFGAHRQGHRRPVPNADRQTLTESEQAFVVGFLALLGNVKMFMMAISAASCSPCCWFPPTPWHVRAGTHARSGRAQDAGYTPAIVLG